MYPSARGSHSPPPPSFMPSFFAWLWKEKSVHLLAGIVVAMRGPGTTSSKALRTCPLPGYAAPGPLVLGGGPGGRAWGTWQGNGSLRFFRLRLPQPKEELAERIFAARVPGDFRACLLHWVEYSGICRQLEATREQLPIQVVGTATAKAGK